MEFLGYPRRSAVNPSRVAQPTDGKPFLTITYYSGVTKDTEKDITFMINLSILNKMFPSLDEYYFLESELDKRPNINFIILTKVNNDLEKAKEIAKNYYLLMQVAKNNLQTNNEDNIRQQISTFLNGTNIGKIYQFKPHADFTRDVNIGLKRMFPNEFTSDILAPAFIDKIKAITRQSNISDVYMIDTLGMLIERLVISAFANYFKVHDNEIDSTFKTHNYNINATYYAFEFNVYNKIAESIDTKTTNTPLHHNISETSRTGRDSRSRSSYSGATEMLREQKNQSRLLSSHLSTLKNEFSHVSKEVISDALLKNEIDLIQTRLYLQSLPRTKGGMISLYHTSSGGQYYRKRKTRKNRKTRKPSKIRKLRKTKKNNHAYKLYK